MKNKLKINRKKIVIAVLCVMACSLSGCYGTASDADDVGEAAVTDTAEIEESVSDEEITEKSVNEIAEYILTNAKFKDQLAQIQQDMALARLYELDTEKIAESAFYTNSSATAEEIAVIKVKDTAYAETVKNAYQARVDAQKESFRDYVPEEIPKLESAVIYENGEYVLLVISEDNDGAERLVSEAFQ